MTVYFAVLHWQPNEMAVQPNPGIPIRFLRSLSATYNMANQKGFPSYFAYLFDYTARGISTVSSAFPNKKAIHLYPTLRLEDGEFLPNLR